MTHSQPISSSTQRTRAIFACAGWIIVAIFLRVGPPITYSRIQLGLQATAGVVLASLPTQLWAEGQSKSTLEIEHLQAENRELKRQLAEATAELQANRDFKQLPNSDPQGLIDSTLTTARVIGRKGDQFAGNIQLLVELGKAAGISESNLVLVGPGLLIDQGENAQIRPDQLLTSGRALLGRTTKVGPYTSLVQPITDRQFKMAARIVRTSQFGAIEGAVGILVGTGNGCQLEEVAATEAVAVGDHVYTEASTSPTGIPIYCGQVKSLDIAPTASSWTIHIEPFQPSNQLPVEVQVLASRLNPQRLPNN